MNKDARIYVAGHRGLVGQALMRKLQSLGYEPFGVPSDHLNLVNQNQVEQFFRREKINYVFMAAGLVGGIKANKYRSCDFLYENALMTLNVLGSAGRNRVKKVCYLGSSCVYPAHIDRPITEEDLLSGPLEKTNEGYAIAKIMGVKLCELYQRQFQENFISVMPCNLYGTNDNFDPQSSHVIPGMLRKFHDAKLNKEDKLCLWGTGRARREFLHADDAADGIVYAMLNYNEPTPLNLGSGNEISIKELADMIREVVGFKGDLEFDPVIPDGTMRKVLDSSKIKKLGWNKKLIPLKEGLKQTYEAMLKTT